MTPRGGKDPEPLDLSGPRVRLVCILHARQLLPQPTTTTTTTATTVTTIAGHNHTHTYSHSRLQPKPNHGCNHNRNLKQPQQPQQTITTTTSNKDCVLGFFPMLCGRVPRRPSGPLPVLREMGGLSVVTLAT